MVCRRYSSGFSLIEVMVAAVIVAILAMIAVPGYQDSVMKGKRSDGKAGLMNVASRMEQYFLDNKTYTADLTDLGFADPADSPDGYFTISVTAATAACPVTTCYKLSAVPKHSDTNCATLTLDSVGTKGPTNCW
jgi:type IV pilus assembly protein PilE